MSALNDMNNYSKNIINEEIFEQKYCAYAAVIYWDNKNNDQLESTDKIVLPPSALSKLTSKHILNSSNTDPVIFEIGNTSDILPKKSHCSVIEFTAAKGCAYLPIQIMDNLGLDYHGNNIIQLTTVNLPKGKLIQVQAHKTQKILSLSSIPKYILEKKLTKYCCLTLGDTIQVEYKNSIYKFDITKVKPSIIQSTAPPAISIIECNIEVDFKEPRDYKQWQTQNIFNQDITNYESTENEIDDEKKDESDTSDFSNDDKIGSPEYFEFYGQKSLPSPESSQSSEQSSNATFGFQGFSFWNNTNNKDTNNKEENDEDKEKKKGNKKNIKIK